jgi:D-arginine dehydrogenase
MLTYDALVIGGGIAGVSLAYELAEDRSVGLLEMESALAYHTSGRSLATFLETYGPLAIRALTTGSRAMFENPPDFVTSPLFTPLGLLMVAPEGQSNAVRGLHASVAPLAPDVRLVSAQEAKEISPALADGYAELGMYDPGATEIDVHALHQGYVKGLGQRGGQVHRSARLTSATKVDGLWHVKASDGNEYQTPLIVNAAGAWVDEVANACGVPAIGIRPLRRTAFLVAPPEGLSARGMPLTSNIDITWYLMPQGDMFACSPAEENLHAPADAKPDELEIARAIEEINKATVLGIRHISSPWAGLRNFVPDGLPVVGFAPEDDAFFWYAGQGGYGMQTAPALAMVAAALVKGEEFSADLKARGLGAEDLSPSRPGMSVDAGH